jgi:hypothetical protein
VNESRPAVKEEIGLNPLIELMNICQAAYITDRKSRLCNALNYAGLALEKSPLLIAKRALLLARYHELNF